VRLSNGVTVVLEIKGFEDDQTKAKHTAANRWVEAVNNRGQNLGSVNRIAPSGENLGQPWTSAFPAMPKRLVYQSRLQFEDGKMYLLRVVVAED
jgi:hypothetical protein